MIECNKCGGACADDALYCVHCGARLDTKACRRCKNYVPDDAKYCAVCGYPTEGMVCPKCGKPMKQITARGSTFYGCTGYPDCRFTANAPLAEGKCPECGSHLLIRNYKDGTYHVCASKTCKYKVKAES